MSTDKPTKKKDIHARKLGAEWLLYDSSSEKLHVLNSSAEFVWRLCDGNHDLAAIKAKMREKYDIHDERKLDDDIGNILKELTQIGVLQGS